MPGQVEAPDVAVLRTQLNKVRAELDAQFKRAKLLDADADQVRNLILQVFEAHADVLKNPEPGVQLDSIDSAGMVFNATAFVNSPRMAYGVRSVLLFDVLRRLREASISLLKPAGLVLREAQDKALELPAQ